MIFIVLGFLTILVIDFLPILKKRQKKDMIVFGVFFVIGFSLAILLALNIEVPSLMLTITKYLEKIGLVYK